MAYCYDQIMKIAALITTKNRTELLRTRSLPSVLSQTHKPDLVVIVDDSDPNHIESNKAVLQSLEHDGLEVKHITQENKSGYAAAVNAGLKYIDEQLGSEDIWVAILDDDDEWLEHHLQACARLANTNTDAVISGIQTILDGKALPQSILEEVEMKKFLSGNPGWEGSNTFCKLSRLLEVGGLREDLICTHDRDLAIRLLNLESFTVITAGNVSVKHYIERDRSQLTTSSNKKPGLQNFYSHHNWRMNAQDRSAFFERANKLFNCSEQDFARPPFTLSQQQEELTLSFNSKHIFEAKYVIGVAVRNPKVKFRACLESFFKQTNSKDFCLLILDCVFH